MAEQNHKNDVRVYVVLPGVLGKFDDQLKATKEIVTEVTKGDAENHVIKGEIKALVIGLIKNFTNYVGNYREDDEVMDMRINQELILALPSSLINKYVGGISEATATAKYTVPVKFDSV